MELVDANTKNYVFLTLSQYNDKQRLVRTRVSMRRDQPFWDGGNSYICCESFRVTSSPSQGGLYYKVFPYNWYMGCDLQHQAPTENPTNYTALTVPGNEGTYPWDDESSLYASNVIARLEGDVAHMEGLFQLQGLSGPGAINFPSNDPTVIRTYLNKFCNEYYLTKGTWIELDSQDTGHDGVNDASVWGRLKWPPMSRVTGNGLGPSNMYYPDFLISPESQAAIKAQLPALANEPVNGFMMPMTITIRPQPGQTIPTSDEIAIVRKELGRALVIQARTRGGLDAPEWLPLNGGGGLFQVMGIQGVTYNFQNRFFAGGNTDEGMGNHSNAPRRPMQYGTLEPGAVCWVDVGADDGYFTTPGRFYGTIVSVPNQSDDGMDVFKLHTEPLEAFKTYVAGLSEVQIDNLLSVHYMLTTDTQPLCDAINCPFEILVQQAENCGPITELPEEDSPWQMDTADVLASIDHSAAQLSCIRRPGNNGDKYVYTPNEMFLMFNKPEPSVGDLPYKLQTDENGGFVIHWNDTGSRPATTFRISIALSEELGLNGHFQYDVERYQGEVTTDEFQVLKQAPQPWLADEEFTTWLPRSALSTSNTEWIPAPPAEATINFSSGEAPVLYDRDGNGYFYVSSHVTSSEHFENVIEHIYPTVETDEYGELYYEYHDLPAYGKITNTQQVSVESFSTYSEITIVIPNLPFQSMLGTSSDERILASLRLPFINGTGNDYSGAVTNTTFGYYGDLIFNTLASRSYLKVTTDQQLYDCDVEVRLIRRDGQMDVMKLPYKGEFQVKLRLLQTQ